VAGLSLYELKSKYLTYEISSAFDIGSHLTDRFADWSVVRCLSEKFGHAKKFDLSAGCPRTGPLDLNQRRTDD
jgi:hypothetical protein